MIFKLLNALLRGYGDTAFTCVAEGLTVQHSQLKSHTETVDW